MKRTLTNVLQQFPQRPYGEFVPGGNTRGAEEAGPLLKRLKEFYNPGPKSKKRQNKRNRR